MVIFDIDFTGKTDKQIIRALDNNGIETYSVFKHDFDRYSKDDRKTEKEVIELISKEHSLENKVFLSLYIIEKVTDLTGWLNQRNSNNDLEKYNTFKNNLVNKQSVKIKR